jgi:hypothetical protein
MILRQIKPEQIVSLDLDADQFSTARTSTAFAILTNVISLTLDNFQKMTQLDQCEKIFPNLIRLSLRYDEAIDLYMFSSIFSYLPNSIKTFEIHCARSGCTHRYNNQKGYTYTQNITIKHFLLDIGHYEIPETEKCRHYYKSCFWKTIVDLIDNMCSIQRIQLVINKTNLEDSLDLDKWKRVMHICRHLKKVILQVNGKMVQNQQLIRKIVTIQEKLRDVRETIRFQVISI